VKNLQPSESVFSEDRLARYRKLLEQAGIAPTQVVRIPRREKGGDAFELSRSQRGLWFLSEMDPESCVYNLAAGFRITGPCNLAAIEQSLGEIIRRHESLRSRILSTAGEPVQIVGEAYQLEIPVVEVNELSGNQGAEARLTTEFARRVFHLSTGPVVRVAVIRRNEGERLICLSFHHIVADGWSVAVLMKELGSLYGEWTTGAPSSMAEPGIQYSDYVAWQVERFGDGFLEPQLEFWKRELAGASSEMPLHPDRVRPVVAEFDGGTVSRAIPGAIAGALKQRAAEAGTTIATGLMAGFQALLYRYSGQEDISIGMPVADRMRAEVQGLIGLFINTIVIRVDLGGEPTFAELLGRVRKVTLEALGHQEMPFYKVVEAVSPGRRAGTRGLFQVMLAPETERAPALELGGNIVHPVEIDTLTAKFDATLYIREREKGTVAVVEYNSGLFDRETIERLLGHFVALLDGAVLDPTQRVVDLPLLSAAESHQMTREWNDREAAYPTGQTLPGMVEQQAAITPDGIAAVFEGEHLSYEKLNGMGNRLAKKLAGIGVGVESRVGICGERRMELVTGLLGILKAGAAYVPLDPALPGERLGFMVRDSGISALLNEGSTSSIEDLGGRRIPEFRLECLSEDGEPGEYLSSPISDENACYVIYTSGSTGRPKGTINTHRAVCNRIIWMQERYELGAVDRVLQKTPFSFDVSVWEFFWPLTTGAVLVLAAPGEHKEPGRLVSLIAREGITVLHFVPSMLNAFLAEPDVEGCKSIRYVISSGEVLTGQIRDRYFSRLRGELHNLYGPTEAAIDVSSWACEREGGQRQVPIGRAISNAELYVVGRGLEEGPIGAIGELYIGGMPLGRGYINRAELTAEKFIPNPHSREHGARMYATGDLSRYLPDGNIEYLRRADGQVKLRGYRIEVGEIEGELVEHPAVKDCAVAIRKEAAGDGQLVAYIILNDGEKASGADLRRYLGVKLPEYMVPAAFVEMERFPVTASGKLDRLGLPSPESEHYSRGRYVAPGNEIELGLVEIWKEALGIDRISVEDDFFALGGQSLLAVRVISRIRWKFAVDLALRDFFMEPTIAGLSTAISRLGAETGQVNGLGDPVVRVPGLERIPRRDSGRDCFELSRSQRGLWFLSEMDPESCVYNLAAGFRITGPCNLAAIEQSLGEIIRRHESLRSRILSTAGEPVQIVGEAYQLEIPVVEVNELSGNQGAEARLTTEFARRVFHLSTGPVVRVAVIRRNEGERLICLSFHHIVADGWSVAVLMKELGSLYGEWTTGAPSSMAEPGIQYSDYVAWQVERFGDGFLEPQLEFWKRELAGASSEMPLHPDRVRPVVAEFDGGTVSRAIPGAIAGALKQRAAEAGTTIATGLMAGFQALLYRYSGQEDISIGMPVADRMRAEVQGLIGLFINTIVIRVDLGGEPTFAELLGRVRKVTLEALGHQEMPFYKVVEAVSPGRRAGTRGLFQVMLAPETERAPALELGGNIVHPVEIDTLTAKFDATLYIREREKGTVAVVEYNSGLFDRETIERLLGHFVALLDGAVLDPTQRVVDLPLLSAAESHQMTREWNDREAAYPTGQTLPGMVEQQAAITPDGIAAVFEGEHLSYEKLNGMGNRLAKKLAGIGVGVESRVGICGERRMELVTGLLGILKAGAAYVPLDPALPGERLGFMVRDSGISALLNEGSTSSIEDLGGRRIPEFRLECLSEDGEPGEYLSSPISDENACYVIYTSGSTGRPKGTINTHRAVCNRIIWMQERYELGAVDRVLQKTPFSFDVSVWEFFWPLTTGAVLVLAAPGEHKEPGRLVSLIAREGITVLHFVPSMLNAFLAEPDVEGCKSIRYVISSGEVLTGQIRDRYFSRLRGELHNLYGPTEAAIDVSSWACEREGGQRQVPIGRAISNAELYVVGRGLEEGPIGAIGELYIGGMPLGRGYINRAELTAEKFIPNPHSREHGARMYATGDLSRYLPDGNIEYLRRADGQVKLRGYRIEVGEIEGELVEHPAVKDCAVAIRKEAAGDGQLVAYIILNDGEKASGADLRRYLGVKLPEYMVPAAFVEMERFPVTASGKLDRLGLPSPESEHYSRGRYVAPGNEIELGLVEIWKEALGIDRISVEDDFFALGGQSLLAVRVISRIRWKFAVDLALRDFFMEPTIAGLSTAISRLGAETGQVNTLREPIARLARMPGPNVFPLAFAQQRIWVASQLEGASDESKVYNMAGGRRIRGRLSLPTLVQSIDEIMRRHETTRTAFPLRDTEPVQEVRERGELDLVLVDLTSLDQEARLPVQQQLANHEAGLGFDLRHSPLIRARLFKSADDDHLLVVTMHHIVSDGWSLEVMQREEARLYRAFQSGAPSDLSELAIQYADFAVWQRGWLRDEAVDIQLDYWRRQLNRAPVLALPLDRPRPAVSSHRGAAENFALPLEVSRSLKDLARRLQGTTTFICLLAAFESLLARYAGVEDVAVGTPTAGRNRLDTEALIGFFVNTLVIRSDVSGNPTVVELLRRVRDTTLAAYAHQDLPFDKLVQELRPERALSHEPLFQVMLVFQNVRERFDIPGLFINEEPLETRTSRFDLTLTCIEVEAEIRGSLEYSTDMFEAGTIKRMVRQVGQLLTAMVADLDCRVMEIPLLTDAERNQVVVEWNRTRKAYVSDHCVHELFEEQVKRTPDAMAVSFEGQEISYAELNRRASQLARHLAKLGAGPELRVALLMDRNIEMVIGLLGVLKSGAAYVPLDAAHPPERLAYQLADSQAEVVVCQDRLLERLPERAPDSAPIVRLDGDWPWITRESDTDLQSGIGPLNLAYLIYTSGSTGHPKAVCVAHWNAVRFLKWACDVYAGSGAERVLASTSICFDLSIFELFFPLCAGGRVVLAHNILALADSAVSARATLINAVPSAVREMLFDCGIPSSVRTLNFAGEVLSAELVRQLGVKCPDVRVHNLYGPTETTTYSTFATAVSESDAKPSIGRPVANTQVYLLERGLQPSSVRVPGEIYIGGDGVSRGYANRPDLTAERYLPDDLTQTAGARMYRTGDLGRYRDDGNIDYLGRIDKQVKIRGFRIELAEIESTLAEHPRIKQSAVIAGEFGLGDQRLVAFLSSTGEAMPTSTELRGYLDGRLPKYMVPAIFIDLPELPRTSGGKIDRRALAEFTATHGDRGDLAFVAPQTMAEQSIARVWRELLGVERVGINDNFFDLGGHSLLLIRAHGKLKETVDQTLNLIEVFEYPTIGSLAAYLTARKENSVPSFEKSYSRAELRRERTKVRRGVPQQSGAA
jgi:amino acid adenylation domain-containing protein